MKTRAQRRKDRAHKIRRRKEMLLNEYCRFGLRNIDLPEGKLANGHEVSRRLTGGRPIKTNTRKSHSRYRCKGGYGAANKYTPHDQRQLLRAGEDGEKTERATDRPRRSNMYTIYSTGCPKCRVLKAKMEQKGIKFDECQDVDKMQEMGIVSVPMLAVDDKLLTFEDAIKFINER